MCQFARKLGTGLRNRRSGSVSDDCYTISLIQFGKSFSQSDLVVLLTFQAYKLLWQHLQSEYIIGGSKKFSS